MIHRERGLGVILLAPARTPLFPSAKEAVMKVIMRTSAAHDGKRYHSGRRVDVPDETAKLWVGLGIAEAANAGKQAQKTATRRSPRTASKQAAPAAKKAAARTTKK